MLGQKPSFLVSTMEPKKTKQSGVVDDDLVAFFELLAHFDYEDQKKLAGVNPGSSDSAPGGSGLGSA